MYATCLHCHGALGANDRIEAMRVGRRLAFDGRRGRLWIVCPRCRRWNLTPLEERWEAIESCERLFRGTRQRVSTANVGLARVAGGVELVRIGEPLRPELAAWRYAPAVRRRYQRATAGTAASMTLLYGLSAVGEAGVLGAVGGAAALPAAGIAALAAGVFALHARRWQPRLVLPNGTVRRLRMGQWHELQLRPYGDEWGLHWHGAAGTWALRGRFGERALRTVIAAANARGGRDADTQEAVTLLERGGGAERFLVRVARAAEQERVGSVATLPVEMRLAVEMALHEETERRALEGELAALQQEWRVAEEIATIADDLLLPDGARDPARTTRMEGEP